MAAADTDKQSAGEFAVLELDRVRLSARLAQLSEAKLSRIACAECVR